MKTRSFIIALALVLMAPATLAGQSGKPAPRTGVTVEGAHIRLGDLFDHVGEKASLKVAYAPLPGKQVTFDVHYLFKLARAHGLKWRPLNMRTRSTVKRGSQIINRDEIEDELILALRHKGVRNDVEIVFSNRMINLHVPTNRAAKLSVEDLIYTPASGRFSAIVQAPANDPTAQRLRITGRVYHVVPVPVLSARKARNEVIRKADIEWQGMRKKKIRRDTIFDAQSLIGMAARNTIRPGRPISQRAVRRPVLVAKGNLVTINLNSRFMSLSAQGRALSDGGRGDVIRIVNTRSKKIIEAKVVGPDRVSVRLSVRMASK